MVVDIHIAGLLMRQRALGRLAVWSADRRRIRGAAEVRESSDALWFRRLEDEDRQHAAVGISSSSTR